MANMFINESELCKAHKNVVHYIQADMNFLFSMRMTSPKISALADCHKILVTGISLLVLLYLSRDAYRGSTLGFPP